MAIIRQRRKAAINTLYERAALTYLVTGLIIIGTAFLPGTITAAQRAGQTSLEETAPLIYLLIATLVVWRGYRKLSILIMLATLYQAVSALLDGRGTHFLFKTEAALPEMSALTNPSNIQGFVEQELASGTPFYHSIPITATTPISSAEVLASLPLPESVMQPLAGFSVQPSYVSYFSVVLLLIAVLMLWRAVRHPR